MAINSNYLTNSTALTLVSGGSLYVGLIFNSRFLMKQKGGGHT